MTVKPRSRFALEPRQGRTWFALSQGEFATEERLALHRAGWTEAIDKLARGLSGS